MRPELEKPKTEGRLTRSAIACLRCSTEPSFVAEAEVEDDFGVSVMTNGSDNPAKEGIFFGVVERPGPDAGVGGMENRLEEFKPPEVGIFGSGKIGIGGMVDLLLDDVDGVG